MRKADFKVGAQFLIDTYKVPATITWQSELSGDLSIETPTYNPVNIKLLKTGIRMYTCFGREMLYSKLIPYSKLTLITPEQNVEAVKA